MKKLSTTEKDKLILQLEAKLARAKKALERRNIDTRLLSSEVYEKQVNLDALLNQMPAMLWAIDKNFKITTSAGSGLSRINLVPNSLVGKSLFDYLQTNDPNHPSVLHHQAAINGTSQTFEEHMLGKVLAVQLDPFRNAEGEITGCIGVAVDITETKLLEEKLLMQHQILELIAMGKDIKDILVTAIRMLESMEVGLRASVLILDSTGRHLKLGAAPSLSEDYITAVEAVEIGPKAGSCGTAAYLGKVVISEDTATDPHWINYRDFAVKQNIRACWSQPIFSGSGKVLGTFALHYSTPKSPDVNQLQTMSTIAHLISIAIEKHHHDDKLNKILKELERSNSELEQFAYAASHDLQEPLRTITSYLQLISRNIKLDETNLGYMNFVFMANSRLRSLIHDLLVFARVGTKRGLANKADCEMIVNDIKRYLETSIQENNATITHSALPVIDAAPTDISLLFQNLITNAIKYKRDVAPIIEINAVEKKNCWLFSVKDNGLGIAKEHTNQLFQVFRRLHTTENYPGTGVGLALCKKVVEIYGGKIWIESELGVGSTFFFTLPR